MTEKNDTAMNISLPAPGMYPFWFWNGKVSEDEIDRQMLLFKRACCRGVVLHARQGNKIEYLSERWFELVNRACADAERLGLKIWIYDEAGFPSGNAGGRIPSEHKHLRQQYLHFEYAPSDPDNPAYAAYFPETFDVADEKMLPAGTELLRFTRGEIESHVDTLNIEAGLLFTALTHEAYAGHCSQYFGNVIEAVYTDDESFTVCWSKNIVYSPSLEPAVAKACGRSLREILPSLVEDLPDSGENRRMFYTAAHKLFINNFIAPQAAWCRMHGLTYTGHLSGDEGLLNISIRQFGSAMPYMRYEDIPAIDDYLMDLSDLSYMRRPCNSGATRSVLKDPARTFHTLFGYKCASSIARQFKDGLVSAEVLTFLKWECPPAFIETQMLFELAMGVNLMTPHACYYTVGDGTRWDCPPSYFFQHPCFEIFCDRFAKWTSAAEKIHRAGAYSDTLLILPSSFPGEENGRAVTDGAFTPRMPEKCDIWKRDLEFQSLILELMREHVQFDLGDEEMIVREAVSGNGKIRLGKRTYKRVVRYAGLPLMRETEHLLASFVAQGGVCACGAGTLPASSVTISGTHSDEILFSAFGSSRITGGMFVNLSGADAILSVDGIMNDFTVYDPLTGRNVFSGRHLPTGFTLRAGAAVILSEGTDENIPSDALRHTAFAQKYIRTRLENISARPLGDNILALHHVTKTSLTVPRGASISGIYAENISPERIRIGGKHPGKPLRTFPCDPCYKGVSAELVSCGENIIELDYDADPLYVAGNFSVARDNTLLPPEPLKEGNAALQGYPWYWGAIEYTYVFTGRHPVVQLSKNGGVAEIFVNGIHCGNILLANGTAEIYDACSDGENTLTVKLFNTPQNFIVADLPAPFGISGAFLID